MANKTPYQPLNYQQPPQELNYHQPGYQQPPPQELHYQQGYQQPPSQPGYQPSYQPGYQPGYQQPPSPSVACSPTVVNNISAPAQPIIVNNNNNNNNAMGGGYYGRIPVNHCCHCCLTFFSGGLWLPFWIAACCGCGCERPCG